MTRYSFSSAFTKAEVNVFLEVPIRPPSSKPSSASTFITFASGRVVILSIIVQGKVTLVFR